MALVFGYLPRNRAALVAFVALGLSGQGAADPVNPAGLGLLDPTHLQWNTLILRSKGLLSSVDARISLRQTLVARVDWFDMPHASEPLHRPEAETVLVLDAKVNTRIGATRRVREESVWFKAGSGRVFQQLRYEGGNEPSRKFYRFSDDVIFRLQRRPANAAELDRVMDWSDLEKSSYPYVSGNNACKLIIESATLLYIASVVDTTLYPTPWNFCVFSRRRLYPVTISTVGETAIEVDYEATDADGRESRRLQRSVTVEILEVTVSENPSRRITSESFYLLGVGAPIRLFMDKQAGVPVQVSGKVSKHGQGILDLQKAHMQKLR